MKLHNKTNAPALYSITAPGAADCGTIAPGGNEDLPFYNNEKSVRVYFAFNEGSPNIEAPGHSQVTVELKKGD